MAKRFKNKEAEMKCYRCGNNMQNIVTDLPFKTSNNTTVIIKNLPVLQCESCREYELEDDTMRYVDERLKLVDASAELEIVNYAV